METGEGRSKITMTEASKTKKSTSRIILDKLMQFHLPLILVLAIVIGITFPAPGRCSVRSQLSRSFLIKDYLHSILCVYDLHNIWAET